MTLSKYSHNAMANGMIAPEVWDCRRDRIMCNEQNQKRRTGNEFKAKIVSYKINQFSFETWKFTLNEFTSSSGFVYIFLLSSFFPANCNCLMWSGCANNSCQKSNIYYSSNTHTHIQFNTIENLYLFPIKFSPKRAESKQKFEFYSTVNGIQSIQSFLPAPLPNMYYTIMKYSTVFGTN